MVDWFNCIVALSVTGLFIIALSEQRNRQGKSDSIKHLRQRLGRFCYDSVSQHTTQNLTLLALRNGPDNMNSYVMYASSGLIAVQVGRFAVSPMVRFDLNLLEEVLSIYPDRNIA